MQDVQITNTSRTSPLHRALAARRATLEQQRQALEGDVAQAYAPIDPATLQGDADRLKEARGNALVAAMAAQQAGMADVSRAMMAEAGRQGAVQMKGGVLRPDGFIGDPGYTQAQAQQRLLRRESALDREGAAIDSAATQADRDEEQRQFRREMAQFTVDNRAPRAPVSEPLVAVIGPDGTPTLLPRSQAAGMQPYHRPTGTGSGNAAQAAQQMAELPGLFDQAERALPKATGGAIGAGIDAGFRAFGSETAGAMANRQLKSISANIVSRLPRMAGAVSDADLAFLKEQAGDLGNEMLSVGERRAALAAIRETINRNGAMPRQGGASGTWGDPAKPAGQPGQGDDISSLVDQYRTKPKGR